jgi:hypothetical protein
MSGFHCGAELHHATSALILLLVLLGGSFEVSHAMRRQQQQQQQTAATVQLQESILRQMVENSVDDIGDSLAAERNPAFFLPLMHLRPKQDTDAPRASSSSTGTTIRTTRLLTKAQQRVFDACSQ